MVEQLLCIFKISKKEKGSFRYIGLNVVQAVKTFSLTRITVSSLKPVELSADRKKFHKKMKNYQLEKSQN